MTVFCKDCIHFEFNKAGFHTCASPKQPVISSGSYFVTGESTAYKRRWPYCNVQRESEVAGTCGRDGKNFEPKIKSIVSSTPDGLNPTNLQQASS